MNVRGGRGPRDPMATPQSGERANPYARTGRYGRGPGDQRRYDRYGDEGGGLAGVVRFVAFLAILALLVLVTMATVARPLVRAVVVPWAEGNPGALRIGFVADLVREDLGAALTDPAGTDPTTVAFVVNAGDTAATLAPRLHDAHVIASERAFLFLAQTEDLAPKLTAGTFTLALNLTPAQVLVGLVENRMLVTTVNVTFREGLRLEQMTAKLLTVGGTRVDPKAFYDLVTKPTDALLADYPWLLDEKVRPKGASLEGFLYPATYSLRLDDTNPTTAEGLVRMMLDAFHERVGPDRMNVPASRKLTFYQVLTLASIVDKEVVLDKERPLIAGVYQNRIDRKPGVTLGLLQADPTVIYAVDTVKLGAYNPAWVDFVFWTVPEGVSLKDQPLPASLQGYNTYVVQGLPPGPIDTPTVSSIDAALAPDTNSGFTYFVAIPNGGGAHDFSKTLAEHQAKLKKYGY